MVSRKKAAAKARKAAKAKAREEQVHERVMTRIQRLPCKHGIDPLSSQKDSIVFRFVRVFQEVFSRGGDVGECLTDAKNATMDKFVEVWNDSAKMEAALSFYVCMGAQVLLESNCDYARGHATVARFFEQHIAVELKRTQALINWPKILEAHHADLHTLIKFFWKRIPCSCLDGRYYVVKSIKKVGFCYNPQCKYSFDGEEVERSKTMYCSRCRCVTYCSRECQETHWTVHKPNCYKNAAIIANFEAKQQDI